MKGIRYRIQFRIEDTGRVSENRDNRIDAIFSSIRNVDTNEKIDCPSVGSIIEIDEVDYEITSKKYSFLNEGDFVIFTTIVGIINAKTKEEIEKEIREKEKDLTYERLKQLIR